MRLRSSSVSPRAACALASSALALACARLASACRACTSRMRRSSSSSGWPATTRAPGSTSTLATRMPVSSTPSDISCQAATDPEATIWRSTVCRCGWVTVTVSEDTGAAGLPPPLQAVSVATTSTRPPNSKKRFTMPPTIRTWLRPRHHATAADQGPATLLTPRSRNIDECPYFAQSREELSVD